MEICFNQQNEPHWTVHSLTGFIDLFRPNSSKTILHKKETIPEVCADFPKMSFKRLKSDKYY